nr:HNH endonuclease [uncultured Cellulosilyticum sp.]
MSKNEFEINGDRIYISRDGWNKLGSTTYRADYYEELKSVTWTKKGEYLYSNKLKKYLHRYIAEKWYGEEMVKWMDSHLFVVDHMDNNGFNCEISNLEFLPNDENKAKGLTVDKQVAKIRGKLAICMFKDFSTNLYQLTIGFNVEAYELENGKYTPIVWMKLLYDTEYSQVIHDAWQIIIEYNMYNQINTSKLHYIDKKVECATRFRLEPSEKNAPLIVRNGIYYMVIGDKCRIHSIPYERGWKFDRG